MGNGHFTDVSAQMGPGITEHFSSRGAAFGDYDNDGGIDALILNLGDLPSLLHNVGGNAQNWIKLKLIGSICNRTAIGARVRVITGSHIQIDEVHSGSSVMSQSDLRLHFGLGKIQLIDAIEIKWPTTQKIERFTKIPANQILTIRAAGRVFGGANPTISDAPPARGTPPIVMDHEPAGIVKSAGANEKQFAPGDRVPFDSTLPCGPSPTCLRGDTNLCDTRQVLGV